MTGAPEALGRMRASAKLLTGGAERARSNLWTGRVLMTQGRYRAAADSFRSGLAEPKVDEPLRTLLSVSCWTMARLGYSERLDDPTEDRLPENASTPAGRLELAYAALDAALAGRPAQESRAMALQALGAGALVKEDSDGVGPHLAALALSLSGDLQWAEAVLTAVIELSRERGASSDAALAHAVRATAILRRGRLNDVLADLQAARIDASRSVARSVLSDSGNTADRPARARPAGARRCSDRTLESQRRSHGRNPIPHLPDDSGQVAAAAGAAR